MCPWLQLPGRRWGWGGAAGGFRAPWRTVQDSFIGTGWGLDGKVPSHCPQRQQVWCQMLERSISVWLYSGNRQNTAGHIRVHLCKSRVDQGTAV